MPPGDNRKSVATARMIEEQRFCLELKLRGLTYSEIAEEATRHFGRPISRSTAHNRARFELDERTALRDETRDALRAIELEKLDAREKTQHMLAAVAKKHYEKAAEIAAQNGVTTLAGLDELQNVETQLLRISDRRAKLLGLDAPIQVEATMHQVDPADVELQRMIELAERPPGEMTQ